MQMVNEHEKMLSLIYSQAKIKTFFSIKLKFIICSVGEGMEKWENTVDEMTFFEQVKFSERPSISNSSIFKNLIDTFT